MSCFKDGLEVEELTQDMGWFGALFAARIVAMKAFIEELETIALILKNGGSIESDDFLSGSRGFRLLHNGEAEFNNIRARGQIEATSGRFENATANGLNITGGRLQVGPLSVSDDQIGASQRQTFPATDWLVKNFVNYFLPGNPASLNDIVTRALPMYYGGTYGPYSISSITFSKFYTRTAFGGGTLTYRAEFYRAGVTYPFEETVDADHAHLQYLHYAVIIEGGGAGFTFKLDNIPRAAGPLGTLYVSPQENIVRVSGYS